MDSAQKGEEVNIMLRLEKMAQRTITSANYITSVNGMLHPTRTMQEHDFLYILDGSWEVIEEGAHYELQTDDLLILCAGRHHTGERLCNRGNRHMYFHVLPTEAEQLRNICMDKMEVSGLAGAAGFLDSHTLVHCQREPKVRQYFHELISAYWSGDAQREERLTLLFNLILCELTSIQAEHAGMPGSNSMLERARQKIYSNPQVFFSASEMAAEFYICPRTLNNRFRASCGRTFSAYQMDLKLEMVREFLSHQPDARLHEAAVNFGFYDEFHLSKAFKKKYGYPPSKVRGLSALEGAQPSAAKGAQSIDKKGTLD